MCCFAQTILLNLSWSPLLSFFFFNDTATTEIYTLSLHDALPICLAEELRGVQRRSVKMPRRKSGDPKVLEPDREVLGDRKSTRLNSSHGYISYAVFCLKKKSQHHLPHLLAALAIHAQPRMERERG